jgi:hypothetical protein
MVCVIGGRARVSVKVYLIDGPHEAFYSCSCWVWALQVILHPFACLNMPSFLIGDLYHCTIEWVVLYPSVVLHKDVFLSVTGIQKMSFKALAML